MGLFDGLVIRLFGTGVWLGREMQRWSDLVAAGGVEWMGGVEGNQIKVSKRLQANEGKKIVLKVGNCKSGCRQTCFCQFDLRRFQEKVVCIIG